MSSPASEPPLRRRIDFAASPRPTVGVEWEFALVDAKTRDLSNEAATVIAEIGESPRVHKELLRNTVEIVTGICENTAEAMEDLSSTLINGREIVRGHGMELFCAGTHPFASWSSQKLTDAPRYAELIKRTQWWGRQMLIWGVHVHVGDFVGAQGDADHLVAAATIIRTCLRCRRRRRSGTGGDTGYASNRAMMFQQLPTAGLPFQFRSGAQFEGFVRDQKKTGIIDHIDEIRWDIRPSPQLGTIEVRIFDGVSNLRGAAALVALTHCLIVDLDRRLDAGESLPMMPPWHVQENKWRAARYGLDAVIILDADSNERLVTEDLDDLLTRLEPVARSLGCADELASVAQIPRCVVSTAAAGCRGQRR